MNNPIYNIIESGEPFVYFHTLLFNKNILDLAKHAGKSLEIDISMDNDGKLFIGHPYEFYQYKQMIPPPQNLPIETVIKEAKESNLFLVLDCKDARAIPNVKDIITSYGVDNVLFHSWVDAFEFKPYASEIVIEPHWSYEDLPYQDVLKLKSDTGVPVVSSVRGLTRARLRNEPEILDRIIALAAGKIDAINFSLPNNEAPSTAIMQKLLDNGLMTWVNTDHVPANSLPSVYIGISDHLQNVSSFQSYE